MPTLFQVGSHRVMVYLNDHTPAHVHAIGAGGHAKFELGATPDDVVLVEVDEISTSSVKRIAAAIIDRHEECLKNWEKHHGKQRTARKGR